MYEDGVLCWGTETVVGLPIIKECGACSEMGV